MLEETPLVIVGKVRKAQGIRGEVLVESLSDSPEQTFAAGRQLVAGNPSGDPLKKQRSDGETAHLSLTIEQSRPFKGGWLLVLEGVSDRTEAEKWRGRYFLAPAEELVPPGENEVYLHDLIGYSVESSTHEKLGLVSAYFELPQGLMLEIKTAQGDSLVPYRPEMVANADPKLRILTLTVGVELIF